MRGRSDRNDSKNGNGIREDFVLGRERSTDSYGIRLFVVKLSSSGSCKIIHLDVYYRTITD